MHADHLGILPAQSSMQRAGNFTHDSGAAKSGKRTRKGLTKARETRKSGSRAALYRHTMQTRSRSRVADIVAREARGTKREMLEVGSFSAREGSLRRARGGRAKGKGAEERGCGAERAASSDGAFGASRLPLLPACALEWPERVVSGPVHTAESLVVLIWI